MRIFNCINFIIVIALSLVFSSCSKNDEIVELKSSESASKSTSTLNATTITTYTTYLIRTGQHYCDQSTIKSVKTSEMKFVARFDSSAIYQSINPINQLDINKLYGFSEGFNNQYGGEYAHIGNPKYLRYVLGDNLIMTSQETLIENTSVKHSPIIGWAFDGNPIYGPYGLQDPTSLSSAVVPIQSSYVLKNNLIYNENTNPNPVRIEGPSLVNYPAGTFVEDYEYTFNSLSVYLDQYNGRFCKTPEFPNGIYAYFTTLDAAGNAKFPYMVGPSYYSDPETWNLNQFATQSNIPTGVVRYRTPFEDVDIDIERVPNESTNALTLENGDLLLFEIEDENKDGIISQDEINDPNVLYEEQRLEVFDYFPKIETSSKVDIEIETLNLDLDQVEQACIDNPDAKIITFAHVLGNPPDMKRLMEIVEKYKLILLVFHKYNLSFFIINKLYEK